MELTTPHFIGMAVSLALIIGVGVYSGRKVSSSADFSVSGRKAGPLLVMGAILGTLIGGASTVGTSQMAFLYGFSAWWFTLGGGIACLFIGLFLACPMRNTKFETIPQFLTAGYGSTAGVAAALFVSLGMFLNIVPQVFSSMALLESMLSVGAGIAALATAAAIILYVIFGGSWGVGLLGFSKIILTCLSLTVGGVAAYFLLGGAGGLVATFPPYPWFSLFGRGVNTDLAAGFSLLVGVLSSQIYFQALFAGRSMAAARQGAFLSAVIAPVIGLGGILVGLYMRANYPDIAPVQALPLFIINYLSPWFAGVVLAALFLAAIGTGAGLTLGVSTLLTRDILQRLFPRMQDRQVLIAFRLVILAVMFVTLMVTYLYHGESLILEWSYLSLGLRGAAICFPLLAAIFLKGKVAPRAGLLAILLGPSAVILGRLLPLPVNSLFMGLVVSFLLLLAGFLSHHLSNWRACR